MEIGAFKRWHQALDWSVSCIMGHRNCCLEVPTSLVYWQRHKTLNVRYSSGLWGQVSSFCNTTIRVIQQANQNNSPTFLKKLKKCMYTHGYVHIYTLNFTESVSWSHCWCALSLQNGRNKRQGAWGHQVRMATQCETSPFCHGECLWDHAAELRHETRSERQAVSSLVACQLG